MAASKIATGLIPPFGAAPGMSFSPLQVVVNELLLQRV
jgi:hypothetical protein